MEATSVTWSNNIFLTLIRTLVNCVRCQNTKTQEDQTAYLIPNNTNATGSLLGTSYKTGMVNILKTPKTQPEAFPQQALLEAQSSFSLRKKTINRDQNQVCLPIWLTTVIKKDSTITVRTV